jgi:thiol-disulfide isomerase/thioredoxin
MAQHTIKGVFSPAEDYEVALLYKVTPTVSKYITNSEVKKDGSFQFKLDSTATKGMYRIVYGAPQEDFNFDVIYNTKEDVVLTFNSETGVAFQSSTENKLLASYTSSMSMVTNSISKYFKDQSKDTMALKSIFKTQREAQANYEKLGKGTMALNFIKANKPYIPKVFEDVHTYVSNLESHYFDHVDFNNKTLQSSNFLEQRMLNYVFGITAKDLDEVANYKKNIDVFCAAMKNAPAEVKRILLVNLWQQMVDLKQERVANHISENHLIPIAKGLNDTELVNSLTLFRNISFGQKAPDFSFEISENGKKVSKKLSELHTAKQYVIVFWSSTCSHCLNEIPQLESYIKNQPKNSIKVVAIALEDEGSNWKEVIKKFPDFIHVYGKGKWDNKIGDAYGVTSTPTYFVLDKDKRIVAKPYDIEALKSYFKK